MCGACDGRNDVWIIVQTALKVTIDSQDVTISLNVNVNFTIEFNISTNVIGAILTVFYQRNAVLNRLRIICVFCLFGVFYFDKHFNFAR